MLLRKDQIGRVARLALNRPEKRNALNAPLCQELVESIGYAVHDPGAGAILLTAEGPAFCAGMDLDEASLGVNQETNSIHDRLFTVGARIAKPMVAAVRGAALGGGTGLVANCHIVVAAPDATFGLSEIRLGLWPFLVYRAMEHALGERRTLELSLTGRILAAGEALALGLVHEIAVEPEKRALEIADQIANYSPAAIQNGLSFVQETRGKDWELSGKIASRIRDRVFAGPDFREGLAAFREKRRPRWPSLGH